MANEEQCGDYIIYMTDDDLWEVRNSKTGIIVGKFKKKDDALEKIALILQEDEDRLESESVC
ncbi:unnamed protein product [marine sediment metagenome]|uniref:DUF2188 domain-containing protein n=1 Tax=marine sediment metagenome TaxID=412755 RepID=X1HAH3_9ZZZZ